MAVYNYLSDIKVDPDISSYSMISRIAWSKQPCDRCGKETGRTRCCCTGSASDVAYIDGEHAKRFAGKSAYSLTKSINLAIESISSQSNRPLRLSIQFGILCSRWRPS